jgi:hypothetical protein
MNLAFFKDRYFGVSQIIKNKMKDNYIIYLGGSITQSTNLLYLKKKKYKIILIDLNPNCYCKKYCDILLNVSQTDTKKILSALKKIFFKKKLNIIDCFGLAHFSYPTVNKIKLKYVKGSIDDKFLMKKTFQKKKTKHSLLSPAFLNLPIIKKILDNPKYYWNKIYNFYEENDYKIYAKSDGTHQGIGIIEITDKLTKTSFMKRYRKKILDLYQHTDNIYLEKKVTGRLLNLDFIKKANGQVEFLPIIYRDKVILKNKKKFLSVFQYLDNSNIIKIKDYEEISKIIKKVYKGISAFGTIDMLVNDSQSHILEWSPHFHNSKIYDFLNNQKVLDIYMDKHKTATQKTSNGGYIFLHTDNKETKKLINFVKKNSTKFLSNNIETHRRKDFLKKYAFVKDKFFLIYFKTNSNNSLLKIANYLEVNKNLLY